MDNIREFYLSAYAGDDIGKEIYNNATFKHLRDALDHGDDIYNIIGVEDSLVRERLFKELSYIDNVSYDEIYNKWLTAVRKR